jgi:hypothetical protein
MIVAEGWRQVRWQQRNETRMKDARTPSSGASDAAGLAVHEILRRELGSGLDGLQGTALSAHVPVGQSVVNELLSLTSGALNRVRVDIQSGNTLVIRYRTLIPVSVTAVLDKAVALPRNGPRITLTMRSSLLAGLLSVTKMPFLDLDGNRVTIDLGRIPALAPYAAALACIESMRLTTSEHVLFIDVDVAVPPRARPWAEADPNEGTV